MRVSDEHLDRWRRNGYTLVERFLSDMEPAIIGSELAAKVPTWSQCMASPEYYGTGEGGGYRLRLPHLGPNLNLIGCHPNLIDFAERALATRDIRLTQSEIWAKYTGNEDFEQSMHVDYFIHSLTYPSSAGTPEQVTVMLTYVGIGLDLGPTYVVSRALTPEVPLVPYTRPRDQYPKHAL
jgi:hypothetical protein